MRHRGSRISAEEEQNAPGKLFRELAAWHSRVLPFAVPHQEPYRGDQVGKIRCTYGEPAADVDPPRYRQIQAASGAIQYPPLQGLIGVQAIRDQNHDRIAATAEGAPLVAAGVRMGEN